MSDQWADLDWYVYYNLWERLSSHSKRVAEMVGVSESYLARAMQNRINCVTEEQKRLLRIHRRFYAALILQELCNETPMVDVGRRYKVHKGLLQSLQNSAATFAGMVTVFCRKLGWTCLEVLLEQFQSRLSFGVCRDLCNLVRISLFNRSTARYFYENGFQTVSSIAHATVKDVAKLLRESTPFYSRKIDGGGGGGDGLKQSKTGRCLWLNGKEGLSEQEASRLIVDEAKRILMSDARALGIPTEQLHLSVESSINNKRRNSTENRKNRKRLSTDKITPLRRSKRLSPNQIKDSVNKNRKRCQTKSNSLSPLLESLSPNKENQKPPNSFSEDQEHRDSSTSLIFQSQNAKLDIRDPLMEGDSSNSSLFPKSNEKSNDSLLFDKDLIANITTTTAAEKETSQFFDIQDSLCLQENIPSIQPKVTAGEKKGTGEEGECILLNKDNDSFLESSDSLLLLPDSALKPLHDHRFTKKQHEGEQITLRDSTSPELSLRLSTTEENVDPPILPPLRLHSQFNAAASSGKKQTDDRESVVLTSPECELFDRNIGDDDDNNNSGDLFDSAGLSNTDTISPGGNHTEEGRDTSLNGSSDGGEFLVIDVTASKSLFLTFIQEWKSKLNFTISFSCESFKSYDTTKEGGKIGRSLRPKRGAAAAGTLLKSNSNKRLLYTCDDVRLTGIAVCWGKKDAYYIDLVEHGNTKQNELDDTSLPPDVSNDLSLELRLKSVASVLNERCRAEVTAFDMKEQLKVIFELGDTLLPNAQLQDPKVAQWLLDPSQREKNLFGMAKQWLSEEYTVLTEGKIVCLLFSKCFLSFYTKIKPFDLLTFF